MESTGKATCHKTKPKTREGLKVDQGRRSGKGAPAEPDVIAGKLCEFSLPLGPCPYFDCKLMSFVCYFVTLSALIAVSQCQLSSSFAVVLCKRISCNGPAQSGGYQNILGENSLS